MTSAISARSSRLRSFSDVLSGRPQRGQVARECLELLARGLRRGRDLLGELGLGVGELAELLLPAGLEAARDEAVLGLAGVERALGASGVIAGALDAQLERAV